MNSRETLRARSEAMRTRLFGLGARNHTGAPGFDDFLLETEFGIVWCRPGLALEDRMVCTLGTLASVQRLGALKRYLGAALNIGLTPLALQEAVIQIGIYAGFTAAEEALAVAADVFRQRAITIVAPPPRNESLEALMAQGRQMMNDLHRDASGQGYAAPGNTVTGALYPVAIQYGYGAIWFRPGLTHKQRVLLSVASFTALKLDSQTRKFGQAALNLGASKTEVIEAIIQTAPFSGYAPALNALALLSDTLKET
ncbi:MAG: hypothetical protein FJY56_17415 [Betaproteobacteria bacterium]|nr:hypothetical protein [Betaproteobacteria bacterium]